MNKKIKAFFLAGPLLLLALFSTACSRPAPSALEAELNSKNNIDNLNLNNMEKEKNLSPDILLKYSQAEFETNLGNFTIELYNEQTPQTAANFLHLAENGFYDGLKFHRVIENFIIQAGDPLTRDDAQSDFWGQGGPGYSIPDEFVSGLSNVKGTVAMANSGSNSGGSQFFINLSDNSYLDFDQEPASSQHPVFGRVIDGWETVEKISHLKTILPHQLDRPIQEVLIKKINLK